MAVLVEHVPFWVHTACTFSMHYAEHAKAHLFHTLIKFCSKEIVSIKQVEVFTECFWAAYPFKIFPHWIINIMICIDSWRNNEFVKHSSKANITNRHCNTDLQTWDQDIKWNPEFQSGYLDICIICYPLSCFFLSVLKRKWITEFWVKIPFVLICFGLQLYIESEFDVISCGWLF